MLGNVRVTFTFDPGDLTTSSNSITVVVEVHAVSYTHALRCGYKVIEHVPFPIVSIEMVYLDGGA